MKKAKLFGKKDDAYFDYWSLAHISSFVLITYFFLIHLTPFWSFIWFLIIAYGWEFLEQLLENDKKFFQAIFSSHECWENRWVGDPISDFVGYILVYLYFFIR